MTKILLKKLVEQIYFTVFWGKVLRQTGKTSFPVSPAAAASRQSFETFYSETRKTIVTITWIALESNILKLWRGCISGLMSNALSPL